MRLLISFVMVLVGWSSLTGCTGLKKFYNNQTKAQEDFHDEYRAAGDEGRAEMTRQKETDGLTPLLQSPEARAIEKNLGID